MIIDIQDGDRLTFDCGSYGTVTITHDTEFDGPIQYDTTKSRMLLKIVRCNKIIYEKQ